MTTKTGLQKIGSHGVRNIVRGMLANPNKVSTERGLMKIAQFATVNDYKIALDLLRKSQLFKLNDFSRYFPKHFSGPFDFPKYVEDEIIEQINLSSTKIAELITIAYDVVDAICKLQFESAINHIDDFVQKEGASVFLLRLAYYIKNRTDQPNLVKKIDGLLDRLQARNIRYPQLVIRELTSQNTEYLNIREKVNFAESDYLGLIAKSLTDHIPRSSEVFLQTLNSFYAISALDATLYYLVVSRTQVFGDLAKIEESIVSSYSKLAMLVPDRHYADSGDPGLSFFRDSLLLIELNVCYEYRTCHGAFYSVTDGKAFKRLPFETGLIKGYFSEIRSLRDVVSFVDVATNESNCAIAWFEKSTALMYILEQLDGEVSDEATFVELMSSTRDIGVICEKRYLLSMSNKAKSDEFRLVVACLSYIKSQTQMNEHELRSVIQEIAMSRFDSDLVFLLENLYHKSPSVTEHLIQVMDEAFLTKLFIMVDRPNAAIEHRAKIFEWYSAKIGDSTYFERAKNLRIDVQINKEKGTIDDARIYVDPVKFVQWINDNVLDQLSLLVADICAENEPSLPSMEWSKVRSGMTQLEQAAAILLKIYDEFCSNKKFGIASYIGRRIRHGTLKNTGFNDVKNFAARDVSTDLLTIESFNQEFRGWISEYENCLVDLRDNYVHIQDEKHPKGMIVRHFDSPGKVSSANHMLLEVLKSFYNNKNGLEMPYIITEYCWRLIEEDLTKLRELIMERKASYGVFRFDCTNGARVRQREVQEFNQELNSLVSDKFRLIESWFNKPSIASPSAELLLLFKAVLSEIRGFFVNFSPKLNLDEQGWVIRGGAYFVIYDALFIIIYNAAKYGKPDGELYFGVVIEEKEGNAHFKITIASELADSDDPTDVRNSIQSALDDDCEDALVVEGRSGIRKLRRLEQDLYIRNVVYSFDRNRVVASFEFVLDYQS